MDFLGKTEGAVARRQIGQCTLDTFDHVADVERENDRGSLRSEPVFAQFAIVGLRIETNMAPRPRTFETVRSLCFNAQLTKDMATTSFDSYHLLAVGILKVLLLADGALLFLQ